jgi:glutathione synthase/RimK-type ligase-like ATP-grasp enzyme
MVFQVLSALPNRAESAILAGANGGGPVIGILHADPREPEIAMCDRLRAMGASVELLDVRSIDMSRQKYFDCVLNRVYPSTVFQQSESIVDQTIAAVKGFEQSGVFVMSGMLATLTDYSKLLAAQVLSMQGVRTPLTLPLTGDLAKGSPPFLPLVVKPNLGALGRDCVRVGSTDQWRAEIGKSDWRTRLRVIQECINPLGEVDYRITVMFGQVEFATRRCLIGGWFGNNQGPSEITDAMGDLPTEARELAVRSTQAIGALANGVDLMIDRNGPVVIENNPTLGFRPGSSKVDVFARRVFDFLVRRGHVQARRANAVP